MPVAAVSYDDGVAYTSWLAASGRVPGARMCDDYEWERAARGADGRTFPGGATLGVDDSNHDVTYGRRPLGFGPDEVGEHPRLAQPLGVDDLAGNVWEWVRSGGAPRRVWSTAAAAGTWASCRAAPPIARSAERTTRHPFHGLRVCANAGRRPVAVAPAGRGQRPPASMNFSTIDALGTSGRRRARSRRMVAVMGFCSTGASRAASTSSPRRGRGRGRRPRARLPTSSRISLVASPSSCDGGAGRHAGVRHASPSRATSAAASRC